MIVNWEEITIGRITKKPSYMVNNETILTPLLYNKRKMIIQTPKSTFLRRPLQFMNDNHYMKVSLLFSYYIFNPNIKKFIDKIIVLEKQLEDIYNSSGKKFKRSINFSKDKQSAFLNVNIQVFNNSPIISIFDNNKKSVSLDYILPNSRALNLIYMKDLWENKRNIGINWLILQSKIYLPIFEIKECLIVDDEVVSNYTASNASNAKSAYVKNELKSPIAISGLDTYMKYINMKKFGVPDKAIQVELHKNNLCFEKYIECLNSYQESKGKKPNPSPPKINISMLSGVKLKKVKKRKKKNKPPPPPPKKKGYQPPTPNQLQEMLKGLKSIK